MSFSVGPKNSILCFSVLFRSTLMIALIASWNMYPRMCCLQTMAVKSAHQMNSVVGLLGLAKTT